MSPSFSYQIDPATGSLQSCLRALEDSAVYQEMPGSLQFVAELILDELASNTLKYGGPDCHEIIFTADFDGHELRVTLTDDAAPFNPWTDAPVIDDSRVEDLEDIEIGGRGIHMLLQATDTRHYERRDGKNVHILTRRAHRNQDALAA